MDIPRAWFWVLVALGLVFSINWDEQFWVGLAIGVIFFACGALFVLEYQYWRVLSSLDYVDKAIARTEKQADEILARQKKNLKALEKKKNKKSRRQSSINSDSTTDYA